MKYEKSCGAVVYRKRRGRIELLLIKHKYGGNWCFPKGHVEQGENELQTAQREVKEETGLDVFLQNDFRHSVEYFPKPNVKKEVVYFLGEALDGKPKKQEEEISKIIWAEIRKAYNMVSFRNDKHLIKLADQNIR